MNKIATHDSASGERSWWPTWIFIPFARTQSKSVKEQLNAGCRYFDIRVRKTFRGWVCAHGLWETKKSVDDILSEINSVGSYCTITYEGWGDKDYEKKVDEWVAKYPNIKFTSVNIKYTEGLKLKWKCLKVINNVDCGVKAAFFQLDFRSWHTFLPIPWLWKKIYGPNPVFNDEYYQFVDFL